jgi:hypothetical protein
MPEIKANGIVVPGRLPEHLLIAQTFGQAEDQLVIDFIGSQGLIGSIRVHRMSFGICGVYQVRKS